MKKQVKRVFSVLIALSVLLCSSVTFVNTAVSATSDVVFELDAANLADKSGNGISVTQLGTIKKGSFVNEAGDTVSYMTTGDEALSKNDTTNSGLLQITDERVTKLNDYTIEAWVKYKLPTATNIYPKMFRMTDYTNNLLAFEMPAAEAGDKAIVMNRESFQNMINQATIAGANAYNHYVFTFDTEYDATDITKATKVTAKMYVDGANKGTREVTEETKLALLGTATEFTIGGHTNSGTTLNLAFPGDFATFKIYNTVKTGDEIKALYENSVHDYVEGPNVEEGGVLLDIDPVTLSDRSGNETPVSKLGTITNGSFTNSSGETIPYMTTGNGTDALTNSAKAGTLRITDKNIIGLKDYTIETWMRYKVPSDTNVYPKMFLHAGSTGGLFAYEMNTNVKKVKLFDTDKLINVIGNSVADKWTHYVFTFDTTYSETDNTTPTGVTVTMYVDGVNKGTATDTTRLTYLNTPTEFTIGGNASSGAFGRAFPGDFATFKIYKGVKTLAEAQNLYNDSVGDYAEWSMEARRPSIGQMEISLGKAIQADSLVGNVKLEKVVVNAGETETVTPAKGGVYASVSAESSSTAVLKFGMLEDNSKYRITFDADIAFTDGSTLGTKKTIEFNTGKSVLIDTDFDDYTTDNLTKDGLSYISNGVMDATTGITIENVALDDGSTDKVLRFTTTVAKKSNYIRLDLEEPVEKDEVLKIEEKARSYDKYTDRYGDVDGNKTRMMRFEGENSSSTLTQAPANAGIVYFNYGQYYDANGFMDVVSNVTYSEDTDTFHASRIKADGTFSMEGVNLALYNIKSLIPAELWMPSDNYVGSYVELSEYKVTRGMAPAILNAEYDEAAKTVTVVFNDDMTGIDADSLELFNRVSAEKDVKVEGTQVSYDASTRTAVINLFEPLAVGDYLVNVTDAVSPIVGTWNGYSEFSVAASTAFTRSVKFKADGVDIVEGDAIPAGTKSLSVSVTFSNIADESAIVFAALYNEIGNLVKITAPQNVPADVVNGVATLNIDGVTTTDGYKMKVFVWDSMTALTPVFTVKSIGVSN